jgi:hypothetical protein
MRRTRPRSSRWTNVRPAGVNPRANTALAASKLDKWFRYTVLGEPRDETVDPKPLKYVPIPRSIAQKRDRALKALLILAILAYVIYLAVTMIILFAQQVDDPPLKTRIYAPKLGSGEPNFPRCAPPPPFCTRNND